MSERYWGDEIGYPEPTDASPQLREALAGRTKKELIDVLVDLATEDGTFFRRLAARFSLEILSEELIVMTRKAIADATAFDKRWANYNFDYDHDAYEEIERNLRRLIQLGHVRPAMELSLELMAPASHQVGMSDEGLMTNEIEACLKPVLTALRDSDLPADEVATWCGEMLKRDSVGFICDVELEALRQRFAGSSSS